MPIPVLPLHPRRFFACLLALLLLLAAGPAARAGGPRHYALPTPEPPVALLQAARTDYLVTASGVFRREGRRLVRRYTSPTPIRCALATDTVLWLGTNLGISRLSLRTGRAYPELLPAPATNLPVNTLFAGPTGTVWAGVPGFGAYQWQAGQWALQLGSPTISAGLSTTDSSVWVATQAGLYRWQHQAWLRYNEEGVANYEIPDNLVDNLLPDNAGNLWVLMSEGLSVFEGVNAPTGTPTRGPRPAPADELPTVRYLGRPGNTVRGLVRVPGQGYLFATDMGLLLLPPTPSGEALASLETAAPDDRIEAPRRLLSVKLPQTPPAPTLLQVDARQRIWLADSTGVTVWPAALFRQAVTQASAKPRP